MPLFHRRRQSTTPRKPVARHETKVTYAVTLPNGRVQTRKSDRVYTHAILCEEVGQNGTDHNYGVWHWSSKREICEKTIASARYQGLTRIGYKFTVVAVTQL